MAFSEIDLRGRPRQGRDRRLQQPGRRRRHLRRQRRRGQTTDARTNVVSTLPDVMEKVKVIGKTDPIPNDTVSVRAGLPAE